MTDPSGYPMNHPLNPMTDPSGYPMNHPINLTDNPIGLKSAYLTDGSSDIRIDQIRIAPLLCELILACAACHLCEKVANFDDRNQSNFGGFDDMSKWFVKKDADEIRNNAYIWKECNTEDARKNHVSETFVRWSEIYRLPYFDPTKFLIVDPM